MMLFSFRNPVGAASAASCCFGPSPACAGEGARRSFQWNDFGFRETEGQVEVLHCLRRSAFEQVVDRGDADQAAPVLRQRADAALGAVAAGAAADPRSSVLPAPPRPAAIGRPP